MLEMSLIIRSTGLLLTWVKITTENKKQRMKETERLNGRDVFARVYGEMIV